MKILIADDEQLAREGLQLMLARTGFPMELLEAENGGQAVQLIRENRPDLVFLDINMPTGNGFDVIEHVGLDAMPLVVFLTAYDEYALEAFRVNAIDYLLKPVTESRLAQSLARANGILQQRDLGLRRDQLEQLMSQLKPHRDERVMIRSMGHVYFLRPAEIDFVEADGDYVTIHTREKSHLVRETMKGMEGKLGSCGFQRIHRSSLVRLDAIRELIANDNGEYQVVLSCGKVLKLSRSYREELCRRLQTPA